MIKANTAAMRETEKNFPRVTNGFHKEIAIIDPSTGRAIVVARFFQPGTQSTCLLWIHGKTAYGRGIGRAGGYGYHKSSAALDSAIRDAGITLHGDVYGREKTNRIASIGGIGESAMNEACESIARSVTGKRRFIVHIAHG